MVFEIFIIDYHAIRMHTEQTTSGRREQKS